MSNRQKLKTERTWVFEFHLPDLQYVGREKGKHRLDEQPKIPRVKLTYSDKQLIDVRVDHDMGEVGKWKLNKKVAELIDQIDEIIHRFAALEDPQPDVYDALVRTIENFDFDWRNDEQRDS